MGIISTHDDKHTDKIPFSFNFYGINFLYSRSLLVCISIFLFIFYYNPEETFAQSGNCSSNTPYYTINLVGSPGGSWTSSNFSRLGQCCAVVNPDRCVEFLVTLDPNSSGLIFNINSGTIPPGPLYYQVNCGPLTPIGIGICLNTPGPHYITFCNPATNKNTYIITSIPKPILTVNPISSSVCIGSPVTYTASGASTYNWVPASGLSSTTGSSVTANPILTTIYTITGTDAFGCTNTTTVSYNPIALPIIEAGTGDTICPSSSTQLHGSGGLFYNWTPTTGLSNPNIANPIATPTASTTYYLTASSASGQIINNGDFTSGNTGFTSSYTYSNNLWPEGNYYIGTDPNLYHANFSHCTDHTSGTGNMMIINGASIPNVSIWCQTVTVTPNTEYQFSTWLQSVHPTSPAILQFSVNGILLGSPFNATTPTCIWQQFFSYWYSGSNTSATICIVNQNTAASGNDFAIDDINFSPLCENTDSVKIFVSQLNLITSITNLTCASGNNGAASVSASGGTVPYTYNWSNGANTAAVSGLMAGSYTVTITDTKACTASASVVIAQPVLLTA
ncbi:MAG: SprB repeat-containing protein, partial [Bacteroidota bacterium]